jgi:hypothetical protein
MVLRDFDEPINLRGSEHAISPPSFVSVDLLSSALASAAHVIDGMDVMAEFT